MLPAELAQFVGMGGDSASINEVSSTTSGRLSVWAGLIVDGPSVTGADQLSVWSAAGANRPVYVA